MRKSEERRYIRDQILEKSRNIVFLAMIYVSGQSKNRPVKAAVGTFPSQNIKKLKVSDHFSKLQCRKIPRRCGEKHLSKSKYSKIDCIGPLFEVAISKNSTPL